MKFNRGENLYLESVKDGYACRAPTIIHLPVLPVLSVLPELPNDTVVVLGCITCNRCKCESKFFLILCA